MAIFKSSNSFRNQQPGETTVFVSRRHWIVLLGPVVFFILLMALPSVVNHFISSQSWYSLFSGLFEFLTRVYFLILWILLFYNIMLFSLNTVVVTNKRVIENQQKGFFKYTLNEVYLDKIQDISVNISGVFSTLLSYGDIEIQSAGTQNKFYFRTLPHPQKIKKIITG
ncbi:MAG: PH domain-containing protein [Candidatus Pacebacteria bacterium]|nr:PH domain-containing protein [Candidatus Paceibacterota bacterium]